MILSLILWLQFGKCWCGLFNTCFMGSIQNLTIKESHGQQNPKEQRQLEILYSLESWEGACFVFLLMENFYKMSSGWQVQVTMSAASTAKPTKAMCLTTTSGPVQHGEKLLSNITAKLLPHMLWRKFQVSMGIPSIMTHFTTWRKELLPMLLAMPYSTWCAGLVVCLAHRRRTCRPCAKR